MTRLIFPFAASYVHIGCGSLHGTAGNTSISREMRASNAGIRPMHLDRLDLQLLAAVQENNRLTSEELGERVGLSPTACQRRLKRLREEGVIEADIAVVSPAALGRPLLMLVSVSLERERADIIDRFKQAIRRTPENMSR